MSEVNLRSLEDAKKKIEDKKQSNEEQRIKRDRILKELELDEICELKNKINNNSNKMKTNFSLTRTINSIIEHKQLSETDRRAIDQGIANAQRLGLDIRGQIVLPLETLFARDISAAKKNRWYRPTKVCWYIIR